MEWEGLGPELQVPQGLGHRPARWERTADLLAAGGVGWGAPVSKLLERANPLLTANQNLSQNSTSLPLKSYSLLEAEV